MGERETQRSIGSWARTTFPGGDDLGPRHCLRLLEEVVELCLAAGADRNSIGQTVGDELWRHHLKIGGPSAHRIGWGSDESFPEPARVAEEMADCEIALRVLAERRGVDLGEEVDRKMRRNRSRSWRARGDGTGYHVPEPDPGIEV